MKNAWWMGVGVVVALTMSGGASAEEAKPAGEPRVSAAQRLRVKRVTLGVGHRAFPDFYDEVTVKMGELFPVGSTNYTARILRFEPDFVIEAKTRKIVSKSNEPDNPAFQMEAIEKGVPHDTSWAFLNFPPHFSKKSLVAFKVLRIEFENHAPVVPKPGAAPGMPPAGARGARPDSASRGARR